MTEAPAPQRRAAPPGRRRGRLLGLLVVLAVYVVPLTAAVVFLVAVDLAVLAVALVVVEALVLASVAWARAGGAGRSPRPARPAPPGSSGQAASSGEADARRSRRQGWLVLAGFVVVVVGSVAVAVLGSAAG